MTQHYAQERQPPQRPACSPGPLRLTFDGRSLRGIGARSPMVFPAVSGKRTAQGEFDQSATRQRVAYQGPIPEGQYWVQPSQLWRNNWLKSLIKTPRTAWGNYRLAIHPFPNTETHGRGGFFLHGGTSPGSAGCIDLTLHMDAFVEQLSRELDGLPECFLTLTVRYP